MVKILYIFLGTVPVKKSCKETSRVLSCGFTSLDQQWCCWYQ